MIAYKNKLFNDFSQKLPLYSSNQNFVLLYYLHFYARLSQEISNRMQCVSCFLHGYYYVAANSNHTVTTHLQQKQTFFAYLVNYLYTKQKII